MKICEDVEKHQLKGLNPVLPKSCSSERWKYTKRLDGKKGK